jgi:hypothetical protein
MATSSTMKSVQAATVRNEPTKASVASTVSGRMMAAVVVKNMRNSQNPPQNHFIERQPRGLR